MAADFELIPFAQQKPTARHRISTLSAMLRDGILHEARMPSTA